MSKEIVFHTDIMEQQLQSAMASRKLCNNAFDAVVTITKLSENARKSFYGFHFEKHGAVKQGDIQRLEDGSIRRIEKVLVTFENREPKCHLPK
jgi:hypothetical protein